MLGVSALAPRSERPLPSVTSAPGRRGFVYFAVAGDAVKIGFSIKPTERVKSLQTSATEYVEVVRLIPGTDQTERYFHGHFERYRLRGEWFRLEGALAGFLA